MEYLPTQLLISNNQTTGQYRQGSDARYDRTARMQDAYVMNHEYLSTTLCIRFYAMKITYTNVIAQKGTSKRRESTRVYPR